MNKKETKILKEAIKVLERGYGKGHVKKHTDDWEYSCSECFSRIVISFLRYTINLYN